MTSLLAMVIADILCGILGGIFSIVQYRREKSLIGPAALVLAGFLVFSGNVAKVALDGRSAAGK